LRLCPLLAASFHPERDFRKATYRDQKGRLSAVSGEERYRLAAS